MKSRWIAFQVGVLLLVTAAHIHWNIQGGWRALVKDVIGGGERSMLTVGFLPVT